MSRAPESGRTKSRLGAAIGHEAAARLAEAMLLDAAAAIRAAERWRPVLFVEPAAAVEQLAERTAIEDARPQASGDIGRRMLAALQELAADGFAPLALVGADIPLLTPDHLDAARAALQESDIVFGPAADGGYYLVAMWEPHPLLFEGLSREWGGPRVLATSERIAKANGMRMSRLAMERDIDTIEDLAWLRARLATLEERGEPVPQHTAEALRRIEAEARA
jgi:rSAM/selenodomain-associated transferase 1